MSRQKICRKEVTIKFSLLFDGKQENKQFLGKEILMDIFREKRNFIENKTKIFSAFFEWLSLVIHLIAVLGVLNYLKTKRQMGFFSFVNAKVTHLILYSHNDFFLNFKCNDENSGPSCYECSGYSQPTRLFFAQFSF